MNATVLRVRAIARTSCVYLSSGRCSILHQCIFATRAIARGTAIITVNFDGGGIVDEVDGIVGKDVALQYFSENLNFRRRFWTSLVTF